MKTITRPFYFFSQINNVTSSWDFDQAVELGTQLVTDPNGGTFKFEVDAFQKHCLFNGLDDIGLTLEKASGIDKFEGERGVQVPFWLRSQRAANPAERRSRWKTGAT